MWSSTLSYPLYSKSWKHHPKSWDGHGGLFAETEMVSIGWSKPEPWYIPPAGGGLLSPLSLSTMPEEVMLILDPLATWGIFWDQLSEQKMESVYFTYGSTTIIHDGAHWRTAAFHPSIEILLIKDGIQGLEQLFESQVLILTLEEALGSTWLQLYIFSNWPLPVV